MLRSYLLLIFCVTVWGSNFVFGNMLVKEFSPLFIAMARLLFISLFLLVYTWIRHRFIPINKQEWKLLILLGIIGVFINQWSFYQGLQTADPTTSALILALTPITTALLAAIFLKETLTVSMLVGSLLAISGVFLVVFNGTRLEFHPLDFYHDDYVCHLHCISPPTGSQAAPYHYHALFDLGRVRHDGTGRTRGWDRLEHQS
jgi:drug/metabolite transporter (DMT)-like permease